MGKLTELKIEENKIAIFQCSLNKDSADVIWLKNGNPLCTGDKHTIGQDGCCYSLAIKNVNNDDVAEYSVIVGDKKCSAWLHLDGELMDCQ